MSQTTTTTIILLAALLMAATAVSGQGPASSPNASMFCGANLGLCAVALKGGGPPPAECCASLDKAVKTQLKCLCDILTNPLILAGFGLTVENALLIPKSCGIDAAPSMCSAAKTPSTQGVPPVAGPPKNDKAAATKVAGTGLVGIVFMTISLMLY